MLQIVKKNWKHLFILTILFECFPSIFADPTIINEQGNFSPCLFTNGKLVCDVRNVITNNSILQFQKPSTAKVIKLEIINFQLLEIPPNYLLSLADDLLSVKLQSNVQIKSINQIAFSGCTKLTSLEIISPSNNGDIDLNEVFRELISLEELKLVNLNILELKLSYLTNLKTLTIENSNLPTTISMDTFQNNRYLTNLNLIGWKNSDKLLEQFSDWPSNVNAVIGNLKLENCGLKLFPKLNSNFVKNLTYLSLSKNPIEKIDINDTIVLKELQILILSSTKLKENTMNGLSMLTKLKRIDLSSVSTINDLPIEIENMESLEGINIDMSDVQQLSITLPSSIKRFSATDLYKITKISVKLLSKCNKLIFLNLNRLNMGVTNFLLDNLSVFQNSLLTLSLDECKWVPNYFWKIIGSLKNLEILYLSKVDIESIPNDVLFNLTTLKELHLTKNALSYSSINTDGFQNISHHLTTLDLRGNKLTNLPPCTFYSFAKLDNVNLLDTEIDCDCNLQWLVDKIKTISIPLPKLNFTCTSGVNFGKSLYTLSDWDLQKCSSTITHCMPLKKGHYKIHFTIKYVPGQSKFVIENINGSHLKYIFDNIKVSVQQENKSFHSDIDKYELNRKTIEIDHQIHSSTFTICLILVRNKDEYDRDYNCRKIISEKLVIFEAGWLNIFGITLGIVLVVVCVVVIIVCIKRKRIKGTKNPEEPLYSECSSKYSEPDDTYQSPDQYTQISSNDEYSQDHIDFSRGVSFNYNKPMPQFDSMRPLPVLDTIGRNMNFISQPSKSVDGGLNVSHYYTTKAKFVKSKTKSSRNLTKRLQEFNSLHNLSKIESSLPRKYSTGARASLPQQYLSRDLPVPPEGIPLQNHVSDSPPPKPKFPSTDIKSLLSNADNHLKYFLKYTSDTSLCTDESANQPHSGDSGLGVSKLSNHSQIRLSEDQSVII